MLSSAFKVDYVVAHSLKAPTETLKNFEETDCQLSQVSYSRNRNPALLVE